MTSRFAMILLVILAAGLMAGCAEEEPEPEELPPPPPTPDEIARPFLSQQGFNLPPPQKGLTLPPGEADRFKSAFRQFKASNEATEEGKEALKIVSRAVEQRLNMAEANESWEPVMVLADAFAILNPGNTKYASVREAAEIELRKPVVTIRGIVDSKGQTVAFLDLYQPLENKKYQVRMRPGEELHRLRFDTVIGNNRGIRFTYLDTSESFDVFTTNAAP